MLHIAPRASPSFNLPDPSTHYLFKDAPEFDDKGIRKILSCYESGKTRLESILKQDIYKTEPQVTAGHCLRNVNCYSYAVLEKIKKNESKDVNQELSQSIEHVTTLTPQSTKNLPSESSSLMQIFDETEQKKIYRKTTESEKVILQQLFESSEEKLSDTVIQKVLSDLQAISSDWSKDRIKQYWRNNKKKFRSDP